MNVQNQLLKLTYTFEDLPKIIQYICLILLVLFEKRKFSATAYNQTQSHINWYNFRPYSCCW